MGSISITLPTVGNSNSTEDPLVRTGLSTIQTLVNGNIDGANAPALTSQYRLLHKTVSGLFPPAGTTANTFWFSTVGNAILSAGTSAAPDVFQLVAADHAVTGRTTKLRLRGLVQSNATAPAINVTFSMNQSFVAGGGGVMGTTLGTAVTGSSVTATTPAASTTTVATTSDFDLPADGAYLLAAAFSGVNAANNTLGISVFLQVRNV